jgi:hypothetical protein
MVTSKRVMEAGEGVGRGGALCCGKDAKCASKNAGMRKGSELKKLALFGDAHGPDLIGKVERSDSGAESMLVGDADLCCAVALKKG